MDTKIVQWASDTELLYIANRYFSTSRHYYVRPFVYSLDREASRELLPSLPLENEDGYSYHFTEVYVTPDGEQMVYTDPHKLDHKLRWIRV